MISAGSYMSSTKCGKNKIFMSVTAKTAGQERGLTLAARLSRCGRKRYAAGNRLSAKLLSEGRLLTKAVFPLTLTDLSWRGAGWCPRRARSAYSLTMHQAWLKHLT